MSTSIRELFDIVAAGDDLAAEDAAFLCQRLDPWLWQKALAAAGRGRPKDDDCDPSPASPTVSDGA